RGSAVSHLTHGATPLPVDVALAKGLGLSHDDAQRKAAEMIEWCLQLVKYLELEQQFRLGDIGLDVGVDYTGRFWLIECNPLPDHTIFRDFDYEMYARISTMWHRYASGLIHKSM